MRARRPDPPAGAHGAGTDHGRLHWFLPEELNAAQRAYYDEVTSGPRDRAAVVDELGRLQGGFNARVLDPVVGSAIQNLGAKLRFETRALTGRQRELAILEVAAGERSDYEWLAHRRAGRAAGLSVEEIEAVRRGAQAASLSASEALVRRIVSALLVDRDLDDDLFRQAGEELGLTALFDLVSIVGHYQHTALALRVWRVPVPTAEAAVEWGGAS